MTTPTPDELNTRLADARERAQHARAKIEDLEPKERRALRSMAQELRSHGYIVTPPTHWRRRAIRGVGWLIAALLAGAIVGALVALNVWWIRYVVG